MESQKMYSTTNGNHKNNQEERGKIFVGGLNKTSTTESLRQFFCRFGEVEDAVAMWDKHLNRSRCFGYVKFRDPDVVQLVLRSKPHFIDEKEVDVKECLPRSVTMTQKAKVHKVFVGGLPHEVDEPSLRRAFQNYGKLLEVLIVCDPQTQKPKGFGFVSFEKQESAAAAVSDHFVMVNGKKAEVKALDSTKNRPQHGGGYQQGGYQHPGYPPHDPSMYYQQPPGYGYGYPPDYSSSYGAPSGPWASGPWGPAADHSAPPMMSGPSTWSGMHGSHAPPHAPPHAQHAPHPPHAPHGAPPAASSWPMEPSSAHPGWGMSSGWQQTPSAPASSVAPSSAWSDPAAAAAWQQHAAASSASHYGASMYGTGAQPAAPPPSVPTAAPGAATQSAASAAAGATASAQSAWVMPAAHAVPPGPTSVAPPGTTASQYNYHPYRR